ncbi:GNAT family N-acetyltransferase [Rhizobium mongolense]|uniref:GNAT family N-acetyltransferase n=1 Tax=Rhizobium mongolense TaxID=57676 RepID=UPI003FD899F7
MPVLEVKLDPNEDDREAILNPLLAFNDSKAGQDGYKPLAILLRDDEGGIQGGLWAKCYYDWLFVELLFVPEVMRASNWGRSFWLRRSNGPNNKAASGFGLTHSAFRLQVSMKSKDTLCSARWNDIPPIHTREYFCENCFSLLCKVRFGPKGAREQVSNAPEAVIADGPDTACDMDGIRLRGISLVIARRPRSEL